MIHWFLLLWTACVDFMHQTQGLRFMWTQETKERRPYALHNHLLFASFTATFENSSVPWSLIQFFVFFFSYKLGNWAYRKRSRFRIVFNIFFQAKQGNAQNLQSKTILIDCLQIEPKSIGFLADYTIFTYLCRNDGSFAFLWHHLCLDLAYLHICTGILSTLLQYPILHILYTCIYIYIHIYYCNIRRTPKLQLLRNRCLKKNLCWNWPNFQVFDLSCLVFFKHLFVGESISAKSLWLKHIWKTRRQVAFRSETHDLLGHSGRSTRSASLFERKQRGHHGIM